MSKREIIILHTVENFGKSTNTVVNHTGWFWNDFLLTLQKEMGCLSEDSIIMDCHSKKFS